MTKFSKILISVIAGSIMVLPLGAVNIANYTDHNIMAKSLYSIVEFKASDFSVVSSDNENKFTLYINEGILYIKYSKPLDLLNGEAVVYNLLGQEVTRKKLENNNINQVTLPLQNTCYIVRINYSGTVYTQKVIASAQ
jgi:hypothetical protein